MLLYPLDTITGKNIGSRKLINFAETITDGDGSPLHETNTNSRFFDTMGNSNAFTPAPARRGSRVLPELSPGALNNSALYSRKFSYSN